MGNIVTIAQHRVELEDPHNCTDNRDVLAVQTALFDPLVAYDPQMRYVPGLAESWTTADDARTWTFRLRPDAEFHDGRAVDAEAVACSLKRMARPDMGVTLGAPGVYHQYLADMDLTILDRHTIRLTLAQPLADLLDVLVTGYILPPDALEGRGEGPRSAPVGSGPFELTDYQQGVCVRAARNRSYFNGIPEIETVQWLRVPDPRERLQLIREGKAQIAAGPPYADALENQGLSYIRSRGSTVYIIIFNTRETPLKDPRVRLALNLGVDRRELIDEVLNGAGYPLSGFISPAHFGFDPAQPDFPCDPRRARTLLREAGYGQGLSLTLDSPISLPNEARRLSRALSRQLARIGVAMDIVYTEDRELYANKVRLKDIHDMCVFDSSPLSTFRVLKEKVDARFAGSWWQGYHNAPVEKLLDQAQSTADNARRRDIYRQCFRLLNEDPPWLYLYNYMEITYVAAALSAWQFPAHGVIDPRYLQ